MIVGHIIYTIAQAGNVMEHLDLGRRIPQSVAPVVFKIVAPRSSIHQHVLALFRTSDTV